MRILILLLLPLFSYSQLSIGILESSRSASYDADAQAFFTATGITNLTQRDAINTLVIGLKADGLWTKMQVIYPFVGGTATTHKFNLKDARDLDAAYRLLFVGGWTHSSTGAKPNGTSGYARSYFIPSAIQNVNSNGLGMYITQFTVSGVDPTQMGNLQNINTQSSLLAVASTYVASRVNGTGVSATISGGAGSFDVQKTSSTLTTNYKNGSSVANGNSGGTLSTTLDMYLGTLNLAGSAYAAGYSNSEFRFAYFSEGLNSTEISNLRTRVQTYQTALSRQL